MFGILYTLFVGTCTGIQNLIEHTSSEKSRSEAKRKGKTVYFDYRGNERLVSNNHRAASGVKDWHTGDVGVKDLKTFKLVENWSENQRKQNEKIKSELENKVKNFNEHSKKDYMSRSANYHNGKPIWYSGKKVIYNHVRNEYFIAQRDYSMENDQEVKGYGQDCYYDFHEIFMLKHSLKTKEEIMNFNEKIINRPNPPLWYYKEITQFGERDSFISNYFKTRKQLIDYADQIGVAYRKDRIIKEEYL